MNYLASAAEVIEQEERTAQAERSARENGTRSLYPFLVVWTNYHFSDGSGCSNYTTPNGAPIYSRHKYLDRAIASLSRYRAKTDCVCGCLAIVDVDAWITGGEK